MFTVYIILAGVIGFVVGLVIGDIKYSAIDKIRTQIDFYFKAEEKKLEATIGNLIKDVENLKNKEVKNISAATNKDVADIKSDVNNITPPKA
jgi:selenocysteine-specific translation elongation factor